MENTGAAILAGLATMLAVAAIVVALVWLAGRPTGAEAVPL